MIYDCESNFELQRWKCQQHVLMITYTLMDFTTEFDMIGQMYRQGNIFAVELSRAVYSAVRQPRKILSFLCYQQIRYPELSEAKYSGSLNFEY